MNAPNAVLTASTLTLGASDEGTRETDGSYFEGLALRVHSTGNPEYCTDSYQRVRTISVYNNVCIDSNNTDIVCEGWPITAVKSKFDISICCATDLATQCDGVDDAHDQETVRLPR